ncbi:MAG: hypothetical protein A2900_01400 [Candidatus Chisholmbacteria bacterium RIFCSPLOWO2_01_FULL_50_28]|uniref:Pilus assembly protein PilO n=1 Tax=Candidatus Chisholmbacteria bacterium RIFCSPHIGHO2_01_FULL_52_32 TaxID=1797591 RepID=A0A1G1VU92_9BACT|nr:MAG: hypothetical protein A2786_05340 [Candidatus Chisholmbacteria bacterium RIFCSPHIGHO2_01_FULL_52_32]OGY19745.1 MAG: hypothetical protein A2900_01400 [Candidatus Chisholmbacteria bacterium RIFCSPLOWO2_01_FULL_50_28]
MSFPYEENFRRYGRYYRTARKYAQRPEVLISTSFILALFTISFFAIVAIRPTAITIAKLWREIQEKKTIQATLAQKIAKLEEAQSTYSALEEDLALLDRALPETPEFSRLVREMEYLSLTQGLQIDAGRYETLELWVREASASTEIGTHPFTLVLRGTYPKLRSFVSDLERLDRLLSIGMVTMQPSQKQDQPGIYDLTLTANIRAFSFPSGLDLER